MNVADQLYLHEMGIDVWLPRVTDNGLYPAYPCSHTNCVLEDLDPSLIIINLCNPETVCNDEPFCPEKLSFSIVQTLRVQHQKLLYLNVSDTNKYPDSVCTLYAKTILGQFTSVPLIIIDNVEKLADDFVSMLDVYSSSHRIQLIHFENSAQFKRQLMLALWPLIVCEIDDV